MQILNDVSVCELIPVLKRLDSEGVLSLGDDGSLLISNQHIPNTPVQRIFRDDGKLVVEKTGDMKNMLSNPK